MVNTYLLLTLHVHRGTHSDGAHPCPFSESLADKAATVLNITSRQPEGKENVEGHGMASK